MVSGDIDSCHNQWLLWCLKIEIIYVYIALCYKSIFFCSRKSFCFSLHNSLLLSACLSSLPPVEHIRQIVIHPSVHDILVPQVPLGGLQSWFLWPFINFDTTVLVSSGIFFSPALEENVFCGNLVPQGLPFRKASVVSWKVPRWCQCVAKTENQWLCAPKEWLIACSPKVFFYCLKFVVLSHYLRFRFLWELPRGETAGPWPYHRNVQ